MTIQFRNAKAEYFTLKQTPTSKPERVRLIHWLGADNTHARVEATKNGNKMTVPANLLTRV